MRNVVTIAIVGLFFTACAESSKSPAPRPAPARTRDASVATKAEGKAKPIEGKTEAEVKNAASQYEVSDESWSEFEKATKEEFQLKEAASAEGGVPVARRGVVVLNDSVSLAAEESKTTYERIDLGMKTLFDLGLRSAYGKVVFLNGTQATWPAFLEGVAKLAKDPQVDVVDAIINLHGGEGCLAFVDGCVETADIAAGLVKAVPDDLFYKLRIAYNQACYGETQMQGFTLGGFLVASGTKGEHSTGLIDWPTFVKHWGSGETFAASLAPQTTVGQVARILVNWFTAGENTNNSWSILGDGTITIDTRLVDDGK